MGAGFADQERSSSVRYQSQAGVDESLAGSEFR